MDQPPLRRGLFAYARVMNGALSVTIRLPRMTIQPLKVTNQNKIYKKPSLYFAAVVRGKIEIWNTFRNPANQESYFRGLLCGWGQNTTGD